MSGRLIHIPSPSPSPLPLPLHHLDLFNFKAVLWHLLLAHHHHHHHHRHLPSPSPLALAIVSYLLSLFFWIITNPAPSVNIDVEHSFSLSILFILFQSSSSSRFIREPQPDYSVDEPGCIRLLRHLSPSRSKMLLTVTLYFVATFSKLGLLPTFTQHFSCCKTLITHSFSLSKSKPISNCCSVIKFVLFVLSTVTMKAIYRCKTAPFS